LRELPAAPVERAFSSANGQLDILARLKTVHPVVETVCRAAPPIH
jgi:hypothetical protein